MGQEYHCRHRHLPVGAQPGRVPEAGALVGLTSSRRCSALPLSSPAWPWCADWNIRRATDGPPRSADNGPMTRPSQQLHPQREPSPPLSAATVLLLRDAPTTAAPEVLMTRRSGQASLALPPVPCVFPAGASSTGRRPRHAWRGSAPPTQATNTSPRPSPPSARALRNWRFAGAPRRRPMADADDIAAP